MLIALTAWMVLSTDFAFPDTPAGRCASAYVASFNGGDEKAVREFEAAHRCDAGLKSRSMDERLVQYQKLRADWGTLRPRKVLAARANELGVLIETQATGDCFEFTFEFEKDAPAKLVAIRIEGPVSPEEATTGAKPLSSAERRATVEKLIGALEGYVFPDKVFDMNAALQKRLETGAYDGLESPAAFAQALTEDVQAVCKDKHLRIRVEGGDGAQPQRGPRIPQDEGRRNYGFERVELLAGNVGYIKLNGFSAQREAQETAAAALAFVAHCDALVFDVRENGGGSPEMIRFLTSYLFDEPTHLNSFYDREGKLVSDTWTTKEIPGKRFARDLPVYVLTSGRTFSAAEEFTYNLQCLKRATIVGETSGGGAHPVQMRRLGERFAVSIPYNRAENPITKTNWEGVGVKPEITTTAGKALDAAIEDARSEPRRRRLGIGDYSTPAVGLRSGPDGCAGPARQINQIGESLESLIRRQAQEISRLVIA